VSLNGAVSGLSGSCPNLRFTVTGTAVATDNHTDYTKGRCRDLSNGDTVTVTGTQQANGIVDADTVEINKNAK
jgi:hypothetical protein